MPKSNRVRNSVIDRLLIQQEKVDRAMSTIVPIPKGTYEGRASFHGTGKHHADWQGSFGNQNGILGPGTNDQMPGTTPIFPEDIQKPTPFDKLLELLKIKRKRKSPMAIPKPVHPGFM